MIELRSADILKPLGASMEAESSSFPRFSPDRQLRLASASDPGTPVTALLTLAMEFPEQVAMNPTLAIAIASDPACLDSADPVAVACLLTSPEISADVRAALSTLARDRKRRPGDPARLDGRWWMVEEYLSAWRQAGQISLSVDVSALAPSPVGVPVELELMTRGQALLVRRLGHRSCSAWYEQFKDGSAGVDFGDGQSSADDEPALRVLWPQWDVAEDSGCMWRMGGGRDGAASVSWCQSPGFAEATWCFDLHGRETVSLLVKPDAGDSDVRDFSVPSAAGGLVRQVLAPIIAAAGNLAAGGFLVGLDGLFGTATAEAIINGLEQSIEIEGAFQADEVETDDEDGDGTSTSEQVGRFSSSNDRLVDFIRRVCPLEEILFEANSCLSDAVNDVPTEAVFGGLTDDAGFAQACDALFEALIAPADAASAGREPGEPRCTTLIIVDGSGTVVLGLYGFRWCEAYQHHDIPLDPVTTATTS